MGDVDRGHADPFLQLPQLEAHALAQLGVEIAQGLVEQQHAGLEHDRAREGHALLLTAGELTGAAIAVLFEAHQREGTLDTPAYVVLAQTL